MTTPINDGGPAFPFKCQGPTTAPEFYYGMTLRDYFAAKAMQGLVSANARCNTNADGACKIISIAAYLIADAMLKEREQKR